MTQPNLPEIYWKPLSCGLLAILDRIVGPHGVCYRGVSLYSTVWSFGKSHTVVYCDCVHINNTTVEFTVLFATREKDTNDQEGQKGWQEE